MESPGSNIQQNWANAWCRVKWALLGLDIGITRQLVVEASFIVFQQYL
jgi:hypothetical protein